MWALTVACVLVALWLGCREVDSRQAEEAGNRTSIPAARQRMIEEHLRSRGIRDPRILEAMASVPREEFVLPSDRANAYADHPLGIGEGQTISQPYIVAYMTQLAEPESTDRALEVGTGSGYQAAVLSLLVDTVYTVEIIPTLTQRATRTLQRLGYGNVVAATRDGYQGWREHAPFDVIIVTAAPDRVPAPLVDQLAPGGHMVIPVGSFWQELVVITKRSDGSVVTERVADVRFVPMTGEAERLSR